MSYSPLPRGEGWLRPLLLKRNQFHSAPVSEEGYGAVPLYRGQYNGQYIGQHSGQYNGKYNGQNNGKYSGRYSGQHNGRYNGQCSGQHSDQCRCQHRTQHTENGVLSTENSILCPAPTDFPCLRQLPSPPGGSTKRRSEKREERDKT